ncbi:probable leucine--tRNA ligase, mitochondrial [Colletes gigas]|uniref:probable leucine--tRNA ligase, mitochondrial n=1 Tax=Colletes gigas TaxID=935657 RepID=UPI001C9B71FA|nr:probable leucine--tRNA ligase, mitochondrial [Colletes gigas]
MWKTTKSFVDYRNNVNLEDLQAIPTDPKFAKDDAYMFDSRNYFLKTVTANITETQQLSVAISRLQGLMNSLRKVSLVCMKKSREFERALAVKIIMLAPFAPHFASELWAAFCSAKHHLISENEVRLDKDVMEQDWPEIDLDYKMTLNVHINGECHKKIKIPKYKLDKLLVDEALDSMMNDPEIQRRLVNKKIVETKLLSKAGCDSTMYIVTEKLKETITT